MNNDVAVVRCGGYEYEIVRARLAEAIGAVGGLDFVRPGCRVGIKANLVAAIPPEGAATTHPIFLSALTDLLRERGAEVVIGDSPGGLYTPSFVDHVYRAAGLSLCEEHGAALNRDFSELSAVYEEARSAKTFTYTGWLASCDLIVNACKLKSHGMMGMSAAAKNLFGAIPGTMKPEYHFRYPDYDRFADMIVDLDEYFKPALSVCDAIVAMEGNGPTAGTPRPLGCILASPSPHKLDLVAASLIGLSPEQVPTLKAAILRGLTPAAVGELSLYGDPSAFADPDFETVAVRHSLLFRGASDNVIGSIFGGIVQKALDSRPVLQKRLCVGCNKCGKICPAKAISIVKGKAVIARDKCIRCFCCQEFCPKGAMRVHRTWIAKILTRSAKKPKSNT